MVENAPSSRDYNNGYSINLLLKDLNIAIDCAQSLGLDLNVLEKCKRLYEIPQANGDGNKDFGIVYQYMKKM